MSVAEEAHLIGRWLGFDLDDREQPAGGMVDTRQLRDRALAVLEDYFRGLARRDPVVVLLEDIHWADDSSLDAVRHFASLVERLPMLVVCAARPSLFERRPHWGEGQANHVRLDLQPLSKRDSRQLVDEILQKVDEVPGELREMVAAGAEGNPFYIEELIKMLIEDGVIAKGPERWRVEPSRLSSLRVPPTLTGVLQARVDSLRPAEKGLLQRASVVGRTFWDAAVRFLAAAEPERQAELSAPDVLQGLRSREMIYQHEDSAFEGAREYLFKHALLRDVTYQSVLKRDRRLYHTRAAGWLEEITQRSGRVDEYAALIAEHYEQAGEAAAAARWYRRAGEHAVVRFANAEAIHSFTRALELAPDSSPAEKFDLLLAREQAYSLRGARTEQAKDVEALAAIAGDLDEAGRLAQAWLRRARYAEALGDYRDAINSAERAVELAQAAGAAEEQGDGYRVWGGALWSLAEYPEAGAVYERALAVHRGAGDRRGEASALRGMGLVHETTGSYAAARAHYEQALRIYRETGDLLNESRAANDLGVLSYNQNDVAGAQNWYELSLRLKHKVGDRRGEGAVMNNLGILAHEQGKPGQARTRFAGSLELCRQIGDREGEAAALNGLGSVDGMLGDHEAALRLSGQALEIARQIGDRLGEADVLLSIGYSLLAKGEYAEAEQHALEGLRLTQEIDAPREQAFALSLLGRTRLGLARPDEADADFRLSYDLRRALDENVTVAPALAGIAAAALARGDVQQAAAQAGESLDVLTDHIINDVDDPFWVFLIYYRALAAAGDPRAADVLAAARTLIDERVAGVEPELREAWLAANASVRELRGE